jgi:hypothetical protein
MSATQRNWAWAFPQRVATDALRRIIQNENLPYKVFEYRADSGGWALQIIRKEEPARTEEAPKEKSSSGHSSATAKTP